MDPWKDLASKGVRFVSFGSYNKIWKSNGVVSFYSKEKTFDEEEVALWKRQPAMLLLLRILKRRDKEESRRRNL
jgi:hypothetical protein